MITKSRQATFCALALVFATCAEAQTELPQSEFVLAQAIMESGFPVEKLTFPTKIAWLGLGVVAPERLDDIVGFFAYPAAEVCANFRSISTQSVLVYYGDNAPLNARTLDDALVTSIVEAVSPDYGMELEAVAGNPLTYFCDLGLDHLSSSFYIGFGRELHGPAAVTGPEVFWSTKDAVGLGAVDMMSKQVQ